MFTYEKLYCHCKYNTTRTRNDHFKARDDDGTDNLYINDISPKVLI